MVKFDSDFLALGHEVPPTPTVPPGCNFVLTRRVGDLLVVSGYGPFWGPQVPAGFVGKLGRELTTPQGYAAARLTAINLLLIVRQALGSLDAIKEFVEVNGMVNCVPEFTDQPDVINGCSDLLVSLFGDAGRHTRSAVGVSSLAFGISVEISLSLIVRP
jgi:enamine deaminase RidA (YjgF/YER057c/UK114 family)